MTLEEYLIEDERQQRLKARREAAYLREARKLRGLKQYEAAELLKMSQQQLSQYENGYKKPGEDQIKRFAAAYGVYFLFSGESVQAILDQPQNAL